MGNVLHAGSKLKKLLLLLAILGFIALMYYLRIGDYISLDYLKARSHSIKAGLETDYIGYVVYYVLTYTFLIAVTLPVSGPLTLLGGYLFGLLPGFMYALWAACLGSTISFLTIRYFLGSLLRDRYKVKLERFNEKINAYGYSYLLTLQLLSVLPYVLINILAALTNVPLIAFIWTTILGSIPLLFIYALAGRQLGHISSVSDILSAEMLLMLVLLAMLALLPMVFKRFRQYEEE